ncbi:MAG: hypothetical protein ABI321_09030 [Polyangia bacterium]
MRSTVVGVVLFGLVVGGAVGAAPRHAVAKTPRPVTAQVKPPVPRASFADAFDQADEVTDLTRLVDPLFDTCDPSDALSHRQCEGEREFLETETRKKTFVMTGDPASIAVSPFDAVQKSVDLDIQGCLACVHPLSLGDGKGGHVERFVTTQPPRAVKNGRALGVDVGTLSLELPTKDAEVAWKKREKKAVPRLRTQFVFRFGPTWTSGGYTGVSFVPLAYRVVDACSGEVMATSPAVASGAPVAKVEAPLPLAPGDDLVCPSAEEQLTAAERAAKEALLHLPQQLGRAQIEKGLATVQPRIKRCHEEYDETGMVGVTLVLDGTTGKAREVDVAPPFDTTPAGICVRTVLKAAQFSRFKNEVQELKLSIPLR